MSSIIKVENISSCDFVCDGTKVRVKEGTYVIDSTSINKPNIYTAPSGQITKDLSEGAVVVEVFNDFIAYWTQISCDHNSYIWSTPIVVPRCCENTNNITTFTKSLEDLDTFEGSEPAPGIILPLNPIQKDTLVVKHECEVAYYTYIGFSWTLTFYYNICNKDTITKFESVPDDYTHAVTYPLIGGNTGDTTIIRYANNIIGYWQYQNIGGWALMWVSEAANNITTHEEVATQAPNVNILPTSGLPTTGIEKDTAVIKFSDCTVWYTYDGTSWTEDFRNCLAEAVGGDNWGTQVIQHQIGSLSSGDGTAVNPLNVEVAWDDVTNKPAIPSYTAGAGLDLISTEFSHENTSNIQQAINLIPSGEYISQIQIDDFGHLTLIATSTLPSGGSGEINTASNVGTGAGVFKIKNLLDLQFKSILAGQNITISNNVDEIVINSVQDGVITNVGFNADKRNINFTGSNGGFNGSVDIYNAELAKQVISVSVSGTTTKTITLTLRDGTTLTSSFTDLTATGTGADNWGAGKFTVDADTGVNQDVLENQILSLIGGTGITTNVTKAGSVVQVEIVNDNPDQAVSITGGGSVTVSGSYPNFTITGVDTDTKLTTEEVQDIVGQFIIGAGATSVFYDDAANTFTITSTDTIADGTETKISAGTNVTITGTGAVGNPYIINSTDTNTIADGSETIINAGSNVTVSGTGTSASPYVISATTGSGGEINTASNVGTGEGVFKQKVGVNLEFKNIKAGTNTSVSTVGDDIVVSSTDTTYTGSDGVVLVGSDFRHADTSTVTNTANSSRTYIQNLTFDGKGHVTGVTSGTETVVDTDTTYSISTVASGSNALLRLTAGGSGTGTDDITLAAGSNITLTTVGDVITIDASDTNTTYTAGAGLDLIGTEFSHEDTSTQTSVNNAGRTYIQGITLDSYGHITAISSGTETVVNTDTTYTAGNGVTLIGTEFSHSDTSSQASVNNSGRTYIQDITLDEFGHITAISSATETVVDTNTVTAVGVSGQEVTGTVTLQGDRNTTVTQVGNLVTISSDIDIANTLFVSTNGTDTRIVGDEHRLDKPYATINAAIADSSNGDTIYVFNGTYPLTLSVANSDNLKIYLNSGAKINTLSVQNRNLDILGDGVVDMSSGVIEETLNNPMEVNINAEVVESQGATTLSGLSTFTIASNKIKLNGGGSLFGVRIDNIDSCNITAHSGITVGVYSAATQGIFDINDSKVKISSDITETQVTLIPSAIPIINVSGSTPFGAKFIHKGNVSLESYALVHALDSETIWEGRYAQKQDTFNFITLSDTTTTDASNGRHIFRGEYHTNIDTEAIAMIEMEGANGVGVPPLCRIESAFFKNESPINNIFFINYSNQLTALKKLTVLNSTILTDSFDNIQVAANVDTYCIGSVFAKATPSSPKGGGFTQITPIDVVDIELADFDIDPTV